MQILPLNLDKYYRTHWTFNSWQLYCHFPHKDASSLNQLNLIPYIHNIEGEQKTDYTC